MGADALPDRVRQGREVMEARGQGGQWRGEAGAQGKIVLELPGQAQHLQQVVKGFRRQQAPPHRGLGEPGGQVGEIGQGQGALPGLQFLQFPDLLKFRLDVGEVGEGRKSGQEAPAQSGNRIELHYPEKPWEFQGGQGLLWHGAPGFW